MVSIPAGINIPSDFNVIVEIPMHGGEVKYEYDKDLGLIMVDRFMPTSMRYPCNYGFVPSTLADDGDPVDVLIITPAPVVPGSLMRARAIGMLEMTDEKGGDNKVLAVPISKACAELSSVNSLEDVSSLLLKSLVHFFEHYKDLEPGKWVKVNGWQDKAAAEKEIIAGVKRYEVNGVTTA